MDGWIKNNIKKGAGAAAPSIPFLLSNHSLKQNSIMTNERVDRTVKVDR